MAAANAGPAGVTTDE
nr:hypothetical protein [Escherichia coli]